MPATKTSPAESLRRQADRLTAKIEHLTRPMTQAATPKRTREYNHRMHEGANAAQVRDLFLALADLHDAGNCPPEFAGIRKFTDVGMMVCFRWDSPNCRSTSEFYDQSPRAVAARKLIEQYRQQNSGETAAARERRLMLQSELDDLRFVEIPGFFPTPDKLADELVDYACIRRGDDVLEPSAGIGSLAEAILRTIPRDDLGSLVLCERLFRLNQILKLKGFTDLVEGDFLEIDWQSRRFDRIVANPPFERGQDMDHVLRMWKLLKPGGKIVAIVSAMAGRGDRGFHAGFRELVDRHGQEIEVDGNAFAGCDAFRRTGVRVKIVIIDRPHHD